jgi:uncharacterized membrane protein (DUF4010 family)
MDNSIAQFIPPFFQGLLVATGCGLVMGLERAFNSSDDEHAAGIRTFPITSILGYVMVFIARHFNDWLLIASIPAIFIFITAVHVITNKEKASGITTETSLLVVYCLGIMAGLGFFQEALAIVAITTTLLSLKGKLHVFIKQIKQEELYAFIKFVLLALLIMPLLPKTPFNIVDTLNPFDIGVVVVFISLLSFISYLLMRFTDAKKGILITALIGGLYSSTMITWIFSSKSRTHPARSKTYAAGILVACTLMFLRILVLAVVFNRHLFLPLLIPTLLMASVGGFHTYQLIRQGVLEEKDVEKIDLGNPMDILSALGFAILYVTVAVSLFFMQQWFGTSGVYATGLIVGSADVDAVTISMSKMHLITPQIAVNVIIIASLSNTLVKLSAALLRGSVDLRKQVFIRLGSMLLVGCVYLLVMRIIITNVSS